MAAFGGEIPLFFHLGLSQVAAKRYWEVAAIRRFAI